MGLFFVVVFLVWLLPELFSVFAVVPLLLSRHFCVCCPTATGDESHGGTSETDSFFYFSLYIGALFQGVLRLHTDDSRETLQQNATTPNAGGSRSRRWMDIRF